MRRLRNIIIVVIVLIAIIITAIVIMNKTGNPYNVVEEENNPGGNITVIDSNLKPVDNATFFYTVENCVQQYYNYLSIDLNKEFYTLDENEEKIYTSYYYGLQRNIKTQEEKEKAIYELLDQEYIKSNSITDSNVNDYVQKINEPVEFTALKMRVVEDMYMKKYSVYGKIKSTCSSNIDEDVYCIVVLDDMNMTFGIEPVKEKYDNIDELQFEKTNLTEIEKNDNNKYTYERLKDAELIARYIADFKNNSIEYPEYAYETLDKEYREERFGSIDEFKKFINNNEEYIRGIIYDKYQVNYKDDFTEYVGLDTNGNYYIFEATGINEYKLKLDTYTLESEKFTTEYNKSNDQRKVMMNIEKWVQMLNNRDYKSAYEVLDKTFREENFGTVDDFEEYMKKIYPYFYDLEFGELEEEEGLYIQQITLKNKNNVQDTGREQHIIMQLEKGTTNFVMSFRRVNR